MRYFIVTIVVLIVNIALVAAFYLFASHKIESKNNQILQAQKELNGYGNLGSVDALFSSPGVAEAKKLLIEKLENQYLFEKNLLQDLSELIPEKVWLSEMKQKDQAVVLNGYAMTNNDLAVFIANLSRSSSFASISLTSSRPENINNVKVYRFHLVATLQGAK